MSALWQLSSANQRAACAIAREPENRPLGNFVCGSSRLPSRGVLNEGNGPPLALKGTHMQRRISTLPISPLRALNQRAARLLRKGETRKAALALREAASMAADGPAYVRLAHVLSQLGKRDEALHALKQALYCFRHDHQRGRARTVARMILKLDPADLSAQRKAA
jgi:tetratricopeptide (TPR) repeat protein